MFCVSRTSILPLLVMMGVQVGVSFGRAIDADVDDVATLQPFATLSQRRRMCAELCMSGLGGAACGPECVDLLPPNLPVQYVDGNASVSYGRTTRHGACEVLCENDLGWPLCQCPEKDPVRTPDFVEVCSYYCLRYDYRIFGCQKCSVYNSTAKTSGEFANQSLRVSSENTSPDWDAWCQDRCQVGDGGAACYCDLLPMSMVV